MSTPVHDEWYAALMGQIGMDPRPGQLAAITTALDVAENRSRHVLKAPTATGKSLVALIAGARLAETTGQRTIVCTYTRLLQDQYATSDIPLAEKLFPTVGFAVLKGAANYLCSYNANRALLTEDIHSPYLQGIVGDVARGKLRGELTPATRAVDRWVCSDSDTCGEHDPDRCSYQAARVAASTADVVVSNHMLAVLNSHNPRILGPHGLFIMDEAHNGPSAAESFVRRKVRPDQLFVGQHEGLKQVRALADALVKAGDLLVEGVRVSRRPLDTDVASDTTVDILGQALAAQIAELPTEVRGHIHPKHRAGLVMWGKARADDGMGGVIGSLGLGGSARNPRFALWTAAVDTSRILGRALSTHVETEDGGFDRGVLMMSATTGTPERPAYVAERMGVPDADVSAVASPIDYDAAMRISLVDDDPVDLVKDIGGRSLVLCPSWRIVQDIGARLMADGYGVHTQVENDPMASREVIAGFKAAQGRRAVLIGTRSYFEGIDVPGPALSQIVVVAPPVPFGTTLAEKERRRLLGPKLHSDYLIPGTALVFEQQWGRLLRRPDDRGLVAIVNGAKGRQSAQWAGVAVPAIEAALGAMGVNTLTPRNEALAWFRDHAMERE